MMCSETLAYLHVSASVLVSLAVQQLVFDAEAVLVDIASQLPIVELDGSAAPAIICLKDLVSKTKY